jgi:hypothetical protein
MRRRVRPAMPAGYGHIHYATESNASICPDKDLEIAEIDYKYDAEVLSATQTLVKNNIKSKFQLVIEEFDLSQSKGRVEGFRRRASACRNRLED